MTLDDLWVALCLLLVIEGMMPFLYPEKWQTWLRQVVEAEPSVLRWVGFAMMISGSLLLIWLSP
jgi:uncharacterized protein YjeT (DUF2065 family)